MILSRLSLGNSKPQYSALAKAMTSSRLSFSSWSLSYFLKNSLLSRSFLRAFALRCALSRVDATTAASFSRTLRPCRSLPLSSSISRRTLRAASPSPISLHFSSTSLRDFSTTSLEASTTFSVVDAASTMASGELCCSSATSMFLEVSWASLTLSSANLMISATSFTSFSTFSASSLALRSSSWRRRSSSARFSLISSMRFCACWRVCSASCETFCACEPSDSRCEAWASSSSARRLS
mmetsp:Transcript_109532/g.309612  ORF Transcript_109532/g.309612 Transcript_109532/m.309612 type:complete len:238 (-) Transcript_109532:639-1352(-)